MQIGKDAERKVTLGCFCVGVDFVCCCARGLGEVWVGDFEEMEGFVERDCGGWGGVEGLVDCEVVVSGADLGWVSSMRSRRKQWDSYNKVWVSRGLVTQVGNENFGYGFGCNRALCSIVWSNGWRKRRNSQCLVNWRVEGRKSVHLKALA